MKTDGERATEVFEEALEKLPTKILTRFVETLQSEAPVATGSWIVPLRDDQCGCLIFDGLKRRRPKMLDWMYRRALDADVEGITSALTRFYGVKYDDFVGGEIGKSAATRTFEAVIKGFDDWAMFDNRRNSAPTRHSGHFILSPTGKAECLAIIEGVLAERS